MITLSLSLNSIEPSLQDVEGLRLLLNTISKGIQSGCRGEMLVPWIDAMLLSLKVNLNAGVEVWVQKEDQRLTTPLQVMNAVCQGYELDLRGFHAQQSPCDNTNRSRPFLLKRNDD